MDQHGAPRFESTALNRPLRRWAIALIAGLTFIVVVAAMLFLLPGRWRHSVELRAPESLPESRVGAYLDAAEAFMSRPSAQGEAARSVGTDPSKVDVTITRPALDQIHIDLTAPSEARARETLSALVEAGFGHATREEQAKATERLSRAVTDAQRSGAQAEVDQLAGLSRGETAELVSTTGSAESIDWVLALATGMIVAAAATVAAAQFERARLNRGYERTPELLEVRTRADVIAENDQAATRSAGARIPMPPVSSPDPVAAPSASEGRRPGKHRIAGLEGGSPRPRPTEPATAALALYPGRGRGQSVRAAGGRPERHHYQRRRP